MTRDNRKRWDVARGRWRIRAIRGGKWWRERGQKSLSMLPHLFTLINLAAGFISILLTIRGDYRIAALMIVGSLIADGLDGRLARVLKADGEFGKELDSLADVVSFGTAPAILLFEIVLHRLGYYGVLIAVVFPMCGALRLARFNIIKTSGFFMGVPITAAGTLISCLNFYTVQGSTVEPVLFLFPAVVLLLSYLMISTIPYPDFKKLGRKEEDGGLTMWIGPIFLSLWVAASSDWNPWVLILLPLTAYAALGPWLLLVRQWTQRVKPWLAGNRSS